MVNMRGEAQEDVRPAKTIVVAPVKAGYQLNERIAVVGLSGLNEVLNGSNSDLYP